MTDGIAYLVLTDETNRYIGEHSESLPFGALAIIAHHIVIENLSATQPFPNYIERVLVIGNKQRYFNGTSLGTGRGLIPSLEGAKYPIENLEKDLAYEGEFTNDKLVVMAPNGPVAEVEALLSKLGYSILKFQDK